MGEKMCSKPRKWLKRRVLSGGTARKMPGLQMAGGGDTSGAPQDHRRNSDMPVAAARGRQSVWSCRATRGGHRQGFENAIFTFPRSYSYRGQCDGYRGHHPVRAERTPTKSSKFFIAARATASVHLEARVPHIPQAEAPRTRLTISRATSTI